MTTSNFGSVINSDKAGLWLKGEGLEESENLPGGDCGEVFEASTSAAEKGAKHGGR